jgi:precorrin-3B synthase
MKPRGACPTLATPMQTGDGLLARIIPQEPLPIDTLYALCAAAEDCGNGIIEVTQRGSLQVRGLSEGSAPEFAHRIDSLEIASENGPPLLTSPLLGMDPDEQFDVTEFVSSLRQRLTERQSLKFLGPKVSVLIDGGGALHLDAIAADIRLVASAGARFLLGIAGDASAADQLGYVTVGNAVEAVQQLLEHIAELGPAARARDLVSRDIGVRALDPITLDAGARPPAEPLSQHRLVNGTLARGFALPFGHTTANALKRFALSAAEHGATSIRPAPGRALLAIGLSQAGVDTLCKEAKEQGFVVDVNDPRRHVVACAGAPACAAAKLTTRQLAPDVACAARSLVGTSKLVHLSGCTKGCAHPGPAALTIVGPDRVVLNGRAADTPYAVISPAGLTADVTRFCSELRHA